MATHVGPSVKAKPPRSRVADIDGAGSGPADEEHAGAGALADGLTEGLPDGLPGGLTEGLLDGPPVPGERHCCSAPPPHVHSTTRVPPAVPALRGVRHSPDCTPVTVPSALTLHCWLVWPLQSQMTTAVPLVVPCP
ncbi:hypothetical protein GCM10020218_102510 [Dactylosporangium vinaceum]